MYFSSERDLLQFLFNQDSKGTINLTSVDKTKDLRFK